MAIREKYKIDDIQICIYQLLTKLTDTTAPFTDWTVILNYPESDIFEELTQPFICVEPPVMVGEVAHQGGKRGHRWEMIIGCWDDRKTGGPEEIRIMASQLIAFFDDYKLCHSTTKFTVTLGATIYTDTDLITQGIRVENIIGPREIQTEDLKEFRNEFTLSLRT